MTPSNMAALAPFGGPSFLVFQHRKGVREMLKWLFALGFGQNFHKGYRIGRGKF